MVVYHNDPDGWASARLWYKFLNNYRNDETVRERWKEQGKPEIPIDLPIKFFWTDYGKKPPILNDKFLILVDFSFQPYETFLKVIDKCNGVIWIDHHKTSVEFVEKFSSNFPSNMDYVVYSDNKAACEMVWEYLYNDSEKPLWLKMISCYDVWDFPYGDLQHYLIQFMYSNADKFKNVGYLTDQECWWNKIEEIIDINKIDTYEAVRIGRTIFENWLNDRISVLKSIGWKTHMWDHEVFFVNLKGTNSIPFERFDLSKDCDIWAPFYYDGNSQIWTMSLYSKNVDVSEIAKRYGGGGHKAAAGFQHKSPFWLTTN